jgi:ABC-type dipeptide/oligopeptide/nickel transport system ATPase subunit
LSELWSTTSEKSLNSVLDVFPKPYRPSGGEKQRVLLAMAFKKIELVVNKSGLKPTYFVFDEPTGSLDNKYRNLFLALLVRKFKKSPFTVKIITHDYSIISEIYKNYHNQIDDFRFMELIRKESGELELQKFSAELYLGWLNNVHTVLSRSETLDTVLTVKSNLEVFGRNLSLGKDLVVRRGEMVYLKAASGVGKTTLAKVVMGLYKADKFSMNLSGENITEKTPEHIWTKRIWGKKAGMVFQHADESLNLASSVRELFEGLPLKNKLSDTELIVELSRIFPQKITTDFLSRKVKFLSGGQKQCLNLLRTFLIKPDLIILDEPLNGLDFNRIKLVLDLISDGLKSGSAVLIITHNEEIMEHLIDSSAIWHLTASD